MYVLDKKKFQSELVKRGFQSIQDIASYLGVHRNTIQNLLSGRAVFKGSFETMMERLGLDPLEFIVLRRKLETANETRIAGLVDRLAEIRTDVAFILFGSRASGTAHKYSDWDLGVFSSNPMTHREYLRLVHKCRDLTESWPYSVDLINLHKADAEFMRNIAKHMHYIGGSRFSYIKFEERLASVIKPKAS